MSTTETTTAPPTDDELKSTIRRLIPSVNLERTGINAFTKLLAREYGVDFDVMAGRKKLIRATLVEAINEQGSDEEDEEEEDKNEESDVDDDDDDDGGPPTMKKKRAGGGGGLATKKEISPELAKFLGFRPNEMVARTEIVKKLWGYIRQNDLQNPNNKKEILLDKKMRNVFGCEMFTMFTMNKYISAHVHPFKPVDLTPKVKEGGDRSAKKRRRLSSGKADGSRSKGSKKTKSAGAGGNSNQPPYRLSPALVDVTQADVLPRPQVVKALWAYIRLHNLQNPDNKREILCDDKFKKIMGGRSKVTMFSMNSFIGDHLIERVDRSEYQGPPITALHAAGDGSSDDE